MVRKMPLIDGQEVQSAPVEAVKVENEDWEKAVARNQFNCAIVWAIRRKHPDATHVKVNTEEVAFTVGDWRFHYPTTEQMVKKIIEPLDKGLPYEFKPQTIRLGDGYAQQRHYRTDEELREHREWARKKTATELQQEHSRHDYKRFRIVEGEE